MVRRWRSFSSNKNDNFTEFCSYRNCLWICVWIKNYLKSWKPESEIFVLQVHHNWYDSCGSEIRSKSLLFYYRKIDSWILWRCSEHLLLKSNDWYYSIGSYITIRSFRKYGIQHWNLFNKFNTILDLPI